MMMVAISEHGIILLRGTKQPQPITLKFHFLKRSRIVGVYLDVNMNYEEEINKTKR